MNTRTLIAGILLAAALSGAELATKKALTLDAARELAAAAEKFALGKNWKVAIAVVDEAGNLVYFQRMDGSPLSAVEISQRKARTAAVYGRPSKMFNERIAKGENGVVALPGILPFEGGLPIVVDGQMVGAVGVSGVVSHEDAQIGQAGIDTLLKSLGK